MTRSFIAKGFEVYEITAQDTCFTILGKSFQRIIINKILDARFSESMELRRTASLNARISVESALHTPEEYCIMFW